MTTVHLKLPLPPRELHPNARSHWSVRNRLLNGTKKKLGYRGEVRIEALAQTRKAHGQDVKLQGLVTAHIAFCFRTAYRRDGDNLIAWCKGLFDGLVDAGLLPDDNSKVLRIETPDVVIDRTLKAPEIRLTLRTEE